MKSALVALLLVTAGCLLMGSTPAAVGEPLDPGGYAAHVTATPGAVSVLDPRYGLTGSDPAVTDATAAFAAAMADATRSAVRYADGPSGLPQAVVYVPTGLYRLSGLPMPSNLRLEIDAGAVLEPTARPDRPYTTADPIALIEVGTHDRSAQIRNVTIIGVGSATNELKQRGEPTYDEWDISGYFSADLDASDSDASNDFALIAVINAKAFWFSNIYVVQNDTTPTCTRTSSETCPVSRGPYPSPTSSRAAIVYKPSNQSNPAPGRFYHPKRGTLSNLYTIHSPYGFGPTQIASGDDLTFANIFSQGGTTLRLETDDTTKFHGGEIRAVTADNIVGLDCNRAISLSAHKQVNRRVSATNVTAIGCNNALVQSADNAMGSGSFLSSRIDGLTVVAGPDAQLALGSGGLWVVGNSAKPVDVHPGGLTWSASVTGFTCSGAFTEKSDRFTLDGVRQAPICQRSSPASPSTRVGARRAEHRS